MTAWTIVLPILNVQCFSKLIPALAGVQGPYDYFLLCSSHFARPKSAFGLHRFFCVVESFLLLIVSKIYLHALYCLFAWIFMSTLHLTRADVVAHFIPYAVHFVCAITSINKQMCICGVNFHHFQVIHALLMLMFWLQPVGVLLLQKPLLRLPIFVSEFIVDCC